MSIKIYHGYRCKLNVLESVIFAFQTYLKQAIKAQLFEFAKNTVGTSGLSVDEALCKLVPVLHKASKQHTRALNYDSWINFWLRGKYVYMIVDSSEETMRTLNSHLPEGVEEYGFWNNTESPEGISESKWRKRGRDWESVCLGAAPNDYNTLRLSLDILTVSGSRGAHQLGEILFADRGTKEFLTLCLKMLDKFPVESRD